KLAGWADTGRDFPPRAVAAGGLRPVGGHWQNLAGEHRLAAEARQAAAVDVDAGDLRAGARERARHHRAHAARRAGNDRYPAGKDLLIRHATHLPRARWQIATTGSIASALRQVLALNRANLAGATHAADRDSGVG